MTLPEYHEPQLVRVIESILSPLGWDRTCSRRELAETDDVDLSTFSTLDD